MSDTRSNIEKIKAIIYDYDRSDSVNYIKFNLLELDEIAKRIEREVMDVEDPNEFVNLPDLTKKK